MLKNWLHDITLSMQAKSGVTPRCWSGLPSSRSRSLTGFAFLCVAAYAWLSLQLGAVFAGLTMAGIFLLIALIAAIGRASARRRAGERADFRRAARAQLRRRGCSIRKFLASPSQAGRTFGWQRIVPVALLGLSRRAMGARTVARPTAEADSSS